MDFGREIHQSSGQLLVLEPSGLSESQVGDSQCVEPRRIKQRRATEICDFDLPAAIGAGHDQDVCRLQIFVKHADVVRRGNGLGNIDQKMKTSVERGFVQSTLRGRQFLQVCPGVFTYKIETNRFEYQFQYA